MDGKRFLRFAALVAVLPFVASCLGNETLLDLYLDPDGSAVFSVTERDVRSSADGPEEREREEADYLAAVRSGNHAVARALWSIGARRVRTTVAREEPPYTVVTSGEFPGIDAALSGLLDGLGIESEIELVRSADGAMRLSIVLAAAEDVEPEESVLPLAAGAGEYRFVLTRGSFTGARGFELERDATVARMVEPGSGAARYELTW